MKTSRPVPRALILTIGDELLKGSTLNTNARFLGKGLTSLGFRVVRQCACPDQPAEIQDALQQSFQKADFVVATGGLGPTPDDVTRESIAAFYGVPLRLSRAQLLQIESYYKARRRKMPGMVRKEAMFPANAEPLVNRHGIALGFTVRQGARWLVVLPGVPRELEKMFDELVVPLVRRSYRGLVRRPALTVKTTGLSEPAVMQKLGRDFFRESFDFGIYPFPGEVAIRLQADKALTLARLRSRLKICLKGHVYAWEEKSLPEVIGALLLRRRKTLALAESCTGGLLAACLAAVPGASRYFQGGVVAYNNRVKAGSLGVSETVLKREGAVSRACAAAMACGARRNLGTDYGISITGIAGPGGGSSGKPVGTVFIAISGPSGTRVLPCLFTGDRAQVQAKSVARALQLLWTALR